MNRIDSASLPLSPPDLYVALADLLAQLPAGKVTTYGTLAAALGDRVAARWVGQTLLRDNRAANWPTHRVVRAEGILGGFRDDNIDEKVRCLEQDGVQVLDGRIDLDRFGMSDFQSNAPLATLREHQESLRRRLATESSPTEAVTLVAGVDVSYRTTSQGSEAVAAYALIDVTSELDERREPVWSHVVRQPVTFPYITSYLAFRELPVLLTLLEAVEKQAPKPDVIMVDGSGILHPRRMGIASMLGVLTDHPTIGVTKKRLLGREVRAQDPSEDRVVGQLELAQVVEEDEVLGWAIWPRSGTRRPLYVSPGHRIDHVTSRDVTVRTLGSGRLPEPIYWADRLSRAVAKESL